MEKAAQTVMVREEEEERDGTGRKAEEERRCSIAGSEAVNRQSRCRTERRSIREMRHCYGPRCIVGRTQGRVLLRWIADREQNKRGFTASEGFYDEDFCFSLIGKNIR